MCIDEILQGGAKLLFVLLAIIAITKEVPAGHNHRGNVAVPLGTGVVLEREPTELNLVPTLVLVITIREAEKTEVSETKYRKFALNCLLIDMLIFDNVAGGC